MRLAGIYAAPYLARAKISRLNVVSESRLLRKNGTAAIKQVPRPPKVYAYIPHVAHTAKLLARKNETEVSSEVPSTRGDD